MVTVQEAFNSYKSNSLLADYLFYVHILTNNRETICRIKAKIIDDIPEEFHNLSVKSVDASYNHYTKDAFLTIYISIENDPYPFTIEDLLSKVSLITPKVIICVKGSGQVFSGPIISIPEHFLKKKYIRAEMGDSLQEMIITIKGGI